MARENTVFEKDVLTVLELLHFFISKSQDLYKDNVEGHPAEKWMRGVWLESENVVRIEAGHDGAGNQSKSNIVCNRILQYCSNIQWLPSKVPQRTGANSEEAELVRNRCKVWHAPPFSKAYWGLRTTTTRRRLHVLKKHRFMPGQIFPIQKGSI